MKVSVIIPSFNEEKSIKDCLSSLLAQSYSDMEIVVVDDGSTDKTTEIVSLLKVLLFKQNHLGAGSARNLGASKSSGEILVFVDADMVFDKDFIKNLTLPIREKKIIGTFSKEEFVLNKDNVWSKCWNINKGLPFNRMHPLNYPEEQTVFRAILKSAFIEVGGFETIGYIDDYTLADKLGSKAAASPGAIFYHRNPESLMEVFKQARWIGKSEYKKRKIKNEFIMKIISLVRYSLPVSFVKGFVTSLTSGIFVYVIFKLVFDTAVEISLLLSFFGEQKYK